MRVDVKVPQLPESVAEATLVSWHKKAGEPVNRDENLIDVETDKVVLELPAPESGVLVEVKKPDGSSVASQEVIAVIDTAAKVTAQAAPAPASKAGAQPAPQTARAEAPAAMPSARKMMSDQGIKPSSVEGTGRGARITKGDVLAATQARAPSQPPAEPAPAREAPPRAPAPAVSLPAALGARPEQRVPMSRLRQRVAERLVQSQSTAAILTTFNEVNMQPVIELRNKYKDRFEKEHGVKLGFMGFFVKAVVHALKKFPAVNASIDGSDIVYHGYFDIGMEGKLTVEELTGGTYTISNGGVFGSMLSTPIINPPQSAILGVHATRERPVVENGQIVIRPINYLAQSYDHRIIDGREAVLSLVAIKEALEDPARLLLDL
jgi:2-oxoglutarate dehydrogenase E2 component (dihydrolipoamide succinyltransferase)